MQNGLLPRFFESVTRQAFGDLAIDDAPALRYLTELLTRFVRTEALRTLSKKRGSSPFCTGSLYQIDRLSDGRA